ncbi:MAG TPA: RNA polymerase sigma factor [Nitrospirae bacterium]|nr:ECF RNA polymerase sigma factor SigW [bacterium BMS3Bbin08]HDK81284.1 RNA polymerase sigma factor [Nitrospirota bacterium]
MDVKQTRYAEDLRLIEKYLGGDEYAVEELVMKYQRKVYSLAYRMTGDIEDSKDVTQKTFLQVFANIRGFRKKSSFYTWLYRIAMNTCLNHLKKKGNDTLELNESIAGSNGNALPALIKEERSSFIRGSLKKLPDRQKTAVTLRAYEELSLKETAEVMKCSEGAVKAHYHNGMKRLKEILSASADSPGRKGEGI